MLFLVFVCLEGLLNDNLVPVVLAVVEVLAPVDGAELEDPQTRRRRVAARAAQARAAALLGVNGGDCLRGSSDRGGGNRDRSIGLGDRYLELRVRARRGRGQREEERGLAVAGGRKVLGLAGQDGDIFGRGRHCDVCVCGVMFCFVLLWCCVVERV